MADLDFANNNVDDTRDEDFESLGYSSFFELASDDCSKFFKQYLTAMEESSGASNLDLETSIMSTTSDNVDSLADNFQDALELSSSQCGETTNDCFTDASEYPSLSYIIADANSRLTNLPDDSEPLSLWSATIQDSEEFLDDSPSDFNQYVMSVLEYEDPSANYQFVNNPQRLSHLDNSEALLEQLREMGVSVNRDFLTLDIDFSISGPNSLQDDSSVDESGDCVEPEGILTGSEAGHRETQRLRAGSGLINKNSTLYESERQRHPQLSGNIDALKDTGALVTAGRFLRRLSAANESSKNLNSTVKEEESLSPLLSMPSHDEEVVEAHFTPDGNVKVIYDNLSKDYRSRVSSHDDHVKYLQLMDLDDQNPSAGCSGINAASSLPSKTRDGPAIGMRSRLVSGIDGKLRRRFVLVRRPSTLNSSELKDDFKRMALRVPLTLKELPDRCKLKIQRLLAPEVGVDVSTPDSGVHESMAGLSPEEQQRQAQEWEAELAKTEEEIATLRTVLASKVNHAHELKRRLGITVWKELSDDINQSLKTVRESQPVGCGVQ
ncbi:tumor protein D52 [Trinorchestia longiramus]|nr:tumor protein D52 [Trinorchestia longiramus]